MDDPEVIAAIERAEADLTGADGICTWQTCHEPALPGSPYCAKHAEVVTPDNLRRILQRMAANRAAVAAEKAAATSARAVASSRSDRQRNRRRMEKRSRAAARPHKPKRDHGRRKA